jgi:hypothetical protein
MFEFEVLGVTVSPIAIILAIVVNMIVGMMWYGPLFGKQWMKLVNKKEEELQMRTRDMLLSILLGLLMATGLNSVLQFAGDVSDLNMVSNIVLTSAMIAFTFILPTLMNEVTWEGRDIKLIILNWSHQFVSLLAMSTLLAFFVL